jgi:hypothetical protein
MNCKVTIFKAETKLKDLPNNDLNHPLFKTLIYFQSLK